MIENKSLLINNSSSGRTRKCAYYKEECEKRDCFGEEECPARSPEEVGSENTDLCYVLWSLKEDGEAKVKLKGCWVGNPMDCTEHNRCVENKRDTKKDLRFCCCSGDLCNQNQWYIPPPTINTTEPSTTVTPAIPPTHITLLLVLGPLLILILLLILLYCILRYRKNRFRNETTALDVDTVESQQPFIGFSPITLIEVKATGRFGNVWKGRVNLNKDEIDIKSVAVKIFPPQDKISWQNESEIYSHFQTRHENILVFLGAEIKESTLPFNCEYWLITEYHENGSLYDFLKSHLLTYKQMLKICGGMAKGLNYVHEEIPAMSWYKKNIPKPAIAHRDFKSKNVLLKADLTPCIADFGLALIFYPNAPPNDTLGQVGTRRYMAPEVLEGAINFSRDALLRIDIYAFALVMWECLSRYSEHPGYMETYTVPFEEEVGLHPTLEDMQEVVCQQKKRPSINESWRSSPGMSVICDSIEECWDQDAEARLSAGCVEERIYGLVRDTGIYSNEILHYFSESIFGSPKNGYNSRLITETST